MHTLMTIAIRADLLYETNKICPDVIESHYGEDMDYFKRKILDHPDLTKWSNPEYRFSDDEHKIAEMILKFGW